jgi:hypothetical protein
MQTTNDGASHVSPKRARRWRLAGFVVALAALATPFLISSGGEVAGGAVTTPPFNLPDKGTLTLTTATSTSASANNVVQRDAANTVLATQTLSSTSNCKLNTTPTLLNIATAPGSPGLNAGNIGDINAGPGTSCGLVEAGGTMTLTLGTQLASTLQMKSFAFDIETRKNLKLVVNAYFQGTLQSTYEMRTGTSIVAGQGSTIPGSTVFNCNAAVSSNPNAGDKDNCRFSGAVLADKLVLKTVVGEMALSGGAAGGVTTPSVIQLTHVDALLDCQSQPNGGDFDLTEGGTNGTPLAGITRLDNLDPNQPCQLIPADLNTSVDNGTPNVKFQKDLTQQSSAVFTADVKWPVEAAQNPPPPTKFSFVDGTDLDLQLCIGTPVYNASGHFEGLQELLNDPSNSSGFFPDQAPTLPGLQYSCYFHQTTNLVGNGQVQVEQGIYIVGDYGTHR